MENPATSLCVPKLWTTVKWYIPIRFNSYTTCISSEQLPVTLYYELLEEPNSQLQEKGYSGEFWLPEGTTGSVMGSLMLIYFITLYIYSTYSKSIYLSYSMDQAVFYVLGDTAINKQNKISITKLV